MTTAAEMTRRALDEGLDQLRNGWTPAEVVCVLMDAALVIDDARIFCAHCDEEIKGDPITDPVTTSWLGRGAPAFCCQWCLVAREQRDINATGGAA